ncbi:hypothetical protein HYFRA_00008723 [Hymenoscyphus fraxineus]|uniref:TAP42-like protein n=1 Tax=Hymenoscyphus fraxineus TaxID=746836 RepID=A0A9N9L0D3_9HELO|nr:hypothetical protein HYFRA_00008723 [Hymenoscyphus fraxineus]
MAEQSIKSLFAAAEEKRRALESSPFPSQDPANQKILAAALSNYVKCLDLANRLSLFSPNETLEDLNSGDIQYLLINYHLAGLISRIDNLQNRKHILEQSRDEYENFLSLLDHYELLSGPAKKSYNRYLESPTTFETVPSKDLANPSYLQNDDEAVRELQLANIACCTIEAFEQLDMIVRELEIFATKPPTPPPGHQQPEKDGRERERVNTACPEKVDLSTLFSNGNMDEFLGPLNKMGVRPLRKTIFLPAVTDPLVNNREALRNAVRGYGHNLPTMSQAEALENDRATGKIIEGGGKASEIMPEPDEDNYEKGDEETEKARQWDEYKEENPKSTFRSETKGKQLMAELGYSTFSKANFSGQ